MSMYTCKICGEQFERVGNGVYCNGPHYRPCPVCGKPVEFKKPSSPIRCCSKKCTKENYRRKMAEKPKICQECGKEFIPNISNQKYCTNVHFTSCVICGNEFEYNCHPSDKPKTCSIECGNVLRKQTVRERFGVDNVSVLDFVRERIKASKDPNVDYVKTKKTKGVQYTERICPLCNEPFMGWGTQVYCDKPHYKTCIVCGKEFEITKKQIHTDTCSRKCASALSRETFSERVRNCELCGKPFHPNSSGQLYCEDDHYRPCPICGKSVLIKKGTESLPPTGCSVECSHQGSGARP